MNEFSSLFGCVWRGEAPPEALTDWILTHLPDEGEMKASYPYLNEDRLDPDWAYLEVWFVNRHDSDIAVRYYIRNRELAEVAHYSRDGFAGWFPKWLNEQIDFTYYVLSK